MAGLAPSAGSSTPDARGGVFRTGPRRAGHPLLKWVYNGSSHPTQDSGPSVSTHSERKRILVSKPLFGVAVLLFAVVATGCLAKSGTYAPIDWAAEMHYNQSYRPQEPPRLVSPEGAVPFKFASDQREFTREPAIGAADYTGLANPVARTQATSAAGAELFRVNCSMCHGAQGLGDGRVSAFLQAYNYIAAPNLTLEGTRVKTDGDLYGILTNGINVMPTFKNLLSPRDRWLLVNYIRELQGS